MLQKHLVELQVRHWANFSCALPVFAVCRLLSSMVHGQLSTHPHSIDFDIELFMPYHLQPLPLVHVFLSTSFILVSCKTQQSFPSFSNAQLRGVCIVCSQRLLKIIAIFCFFITSTLLFCSFGPPTIGFPITKFLLLKKF